MTTYYIKPISGCRYCHGKGVFGQTSEYWGGTATEWLLCDCVLDQLPEEFNDKKDSVQLLNDDDYYLEDDDIDDELYLTNL